MRESRARTARLVAIAIALLTLGGATVASGAGFQVLTAGKIARFVNRGDPQTTGGIVVVGRDRALRTLHDPTCPATSAVEVEAYLQSTSRDAVLART
jgi:hypothetical protein